MLSDLWHAARSLSRARGVALVLTLTIGLGIGSQSSIDAFVRGLIGTSTPLDEPEAVVSVFERDASGAPGPLSYDRFLALEAYGDVFEHVGAARESESVVTLRNRSTVMSAAAITPDLARLLGLSMQDGVVISHRVWGTEFGGSEVRRESIVIDAREGHVDGTAPDWLDGLYLGRAVDIWAPLDEPSLPIADRAGRTFWVIGRLRRGVTPADAETAVNANRHEGGEIVVRPYTRMTPETAAALARIGGLLEGAGTAVFLIACANVATFLLARAASRSVDTAVRAALGASRGRIARLLVAESLVLSVAGGATGLVLAWWMKQLTPVLFYDQDAEQLLFAPQWARLVSVAAAGIGAMAACGLIPLAQLRRDVPASVLQRGSAGPTPVRARLLDGLVAAQVACCCLLVLSAGLLLHGFRETLHAYAPRGLGEPVLATVRAQVFEGRGQTADAALAYFNEVERTALAINPIFQGVWVGAAPGSRPAWRSVVVEPPQLSARDVALRIVPWTPALLTHLRMPPIAGRMWGGSDRQGCPGVVINEAAAATLFDGHAAGRVIYDSAGRRLEVIGVVASHDPLGDVPDVPTVYYENDQPDPLTSLPATERFRVPVLPPAFSALVDATVVSPNYFSAMAVTPSAGRLFEESPVSGCRVGVINDVGAERLFGGKAVGGAVIEPSGRRTDIIGVARTPFAGAWQRSTEPAIYLPMAQDVMQRMTIILGTRESGAALVDTVRRQLTGVRGAGGSPAVTTLAAYLSGQALAPERIATTLVGASAAIGVALSVLGLYGAIADAGRRRRREIALRLVLGAQRWRIVGHVVAAGARLAAAGVTAGLLASLVVARWIAGVTGSTDSLPVWAWLATPLILASAVVLASIIPARRAMSVDPLEALKAK